MEFKSFIILGIIAIISLLIPWFEGLLKKGIYLFLTVFALCLAFSLRLSFIDFRSGDYNTFLIHWVDYFRTNGGFKGFVDSIGNYNVPYLYFLAFFSYLPLNDLHLIKILSIAFDVVLAFGMMKLTGLFTCSVPKRLAAYLITLLLPTVIINGAKWGQCDSIYTAFAVLSLWLILSGRPKLSMVCIALSLGFKLQAIFIMPVFLVMLFAKKVKFQDFLIFPLTYIILIIPAVMFGRSFFETLLFYMNNTDSIGTGLNYNSPSIFALVKGGINTASASAIGIAAAFIYVLVILTWTWYRRKNLSDEALLGIVLLFVIGIPFLLPRMHDRYFFMSDVLSLLPAVLYVAYAPVTMLTSFASLICYYAYFNKYQYPIPLQYGTFALIAVLLVFFTFTSERIDSRRNKINKL